MSIMIRRFKLDPAVKQAVAKIKQKLGDEMPTPKVSQAQMAQQTQKAPPRQGVAQPK